MKVEEIALCSPSLIVIMVSVDAKQHRTGTDVTQDDADASHQITGKNLINSSCRVPL